MRMTEAIREVFVGKFNTEPLLILSPGRINLIGEHTDYNEGFVLPAAIDKYICIAMAISDTAESTVYSADFNETYSFQINTDEKPQGWKAYVKGMLHFIAQESGLLEKGILAVFSGNIPVGGGMSSSAALCSGIGIGVSHLFNLNLSRLELALMGQQTEHHFAGVKCGIMDQFAVLHGKKDQLIKLDCRDLSYEYIPFNFPDYRIVMVNTMMSHALAETEYNQRRQQCEDGVAMLKHHYPGIMALRDVQPEMLREQRHSLPDIIYRRCKYVVEEKERLLQGVEHLKHGHADNFGELMYQTHDGLSRDYAVSCPELDFLVDAARRMKVTGSRMMGGGFGGCTLNLVAADQTDHFIETISGEYREKFSRNPEVYQVTIGEGTQVVNAG